MEENINKKNNIQVNALNVGTEKASSKYYSYQNDSTDIIQANILVRNRMLCLIG